MRLERLLVLLQRHGEDAPDAARHHDVQVAPEGRGSPRATSGAIRGRLGAMPLPGVGGCRSRSAVNAGAGELVAARLALLRQKVGAQPIDERAKRGLRHRGSDGLRTADCGLRHCRLRIPSTAAARRPPASRTAGGRTGPSFRNASRPSRTPPNTSRSRAAAASHAVAAVRSRGPFWRNRRSACGATSRRSSSAAMPLRSRRSPSCANTSATSSSSRASAAADPKRLIERLADQPRHLGVVREVEARDRRRPRAETRAAATGRRRRSSRWRCRRAAPSDRAIARRRTADSRLASFSRSMMRWRISAAALRVKVIARMWSGSTPARSRLT